MALSLTKLNIPEVPDGSGKRNQSQQSAPAAHVGQFDIDSFMARHYPGIEAEPYQGGRKWILPVCPWNPDHTNESACVIQFPNGALSAGCRHDSCQGKKWQDLRQMLEPRPTPDRKQHQKSDQDHQSQQIEQDHNDPPILPIEDANPGDLSPDVLPSFAADHAMALAHAKEVSPSMPILLTLPVMASAVQARYVVQIEPGYTESLPIFAMAAMESGERKTAIINPILKPMFDLQRDRREQAKRDVEANKIRRDLASDKLKKLKTKLSNLEGEEAAEVERQIIEATQAMPPEITAPQMIVQDFTEAALSQAMAANGESLLCASDEGGLFDNLAGRHNDIAEIDLFLKSHVGAPVIINRTSRDNLLLTRPLLSVALSPQPGIIAKLGSKPGFIERGLVARFLAVLPKSKVGHRTLNPATISKEIIEAYRDGIMKMVQVGSVRSGGPSIITLSDGAYRVWKAFEREIEPRIGPDGDLRQIKAWASKLAGAVARIAAICHCGHHFDDAGIIPISAEQMSKAINLGRALIPHSVAVHRLIGYGGASVVAEVVKHYDEAGWPTVAQNMTDWWRPVRRHTGDTSKTFEPVASKLVDHGYLIPCQPPEGKRSGKQAGQWFRANQRLSPPIR